LELTREGDGGHSILGGGGIAVGKVGVRWVCTIDNDAGELLHCVYSKHDARDSWNFCNLLRILCSKGSLYTL